MADNRTETLVSSSNKNEAEEVMNFLETLDQGEKKDFLLFMQAFKLAQSLVKCPQTV